MKRLSVVFVLFFTLALPVCAQKRSLEQMKEIAGRTFAIMDHMYDRVTTRTASNDIEISMNSPQLAVFNNASGGWIMISADERTAGSVLAYSPTGAFMWESVPDNAKYWVEEYQRQIDSLDIMGNDYMSAGANGGIGIPVVGPLVTTMWGQDYPYNTLCPLDSKMKRSITGCVATAMAQIIRYWKFAEQSDDCVHTDVCNPECTVDYSESEYDWDNMLDTYYNSFSDREVRAVAKLMYDCGVAVDMLYASSGSGAFCEAVPLAMPAFFGYTSQIHYYNKNSFGGNWNSMLKSELDAHRPIFYSGNNIEQNAGHAFVCDGYDSNGYFHFNWGWKGSCDGYFLTSALNPISGPDLSENQAVAVNIHPADETDSPVWQNGFCFGRNADNTFMLLAYSDNGSISRLVTPQYVEADGKRYSYTIPSLFVTSSNFITYLEINGATSISAQAFYNIPSLKTVAVGDDTNYLSSYAFCDNKALETVYLGKNVIRVGSYAFENCGSLKSVYCLTDVPPMASSTTFIGAASYSDMTLYVPDGRISAYKSVSPWKNFGTIIQVDASGVPSIQVTDSSLPMYNLMGAPIYNTATPGIYIQGGRKYLR